MADIFKEVDEALQQDKMKALWTEYGGVFILAIILLVGGTAATTGYKAWDSARDQEATSNLLSRLESENPLPDLQAFMTDTRSGHAAIAGFISAGMLVQDGKTDEAATIYKGLFENGATPAPLDDIARISYVRTMLEKQSEEPTETSSLLFHLQNIIDRPDSPYALIARLDAAMIEGTLNNNYSAALVHLAAIESAQAGQPSLKDRAAKLTQLYTHAQNSQDENS